MHSGLLYYIDHRSLFLAAPLLKFWIYVQWLLKKKKKKDAKISFMATRLQNIVSWLFFFCFFFLWFINFLKAQSNLLANLCIIFNFILITQCTEYATIIVSKFLKFQFLFWNCTKTSSTTTLQDFRHRCNGKNATVKKAHWIVF